MVQHKFFICGNRCVEHSHWCKNEVNESIEQIVFNKLLGELLVLNTKSYSGISFIFIIVNLVNLVFAQYFDNTICIQYGKIISSIPN
jgi:hypothetical protein